MTETLDDLIEELSFLVNKQAEDASLVFIPHSSEEEELQAALLSLHDLATKLIATYNEITHGKK